MHLIGKEFFAYALTPQNDTIRLIHIPKWNFRWQYFYTFKNPVKIPAGSTIVVEGTFDNTADNPNNPYDPPRVIIDRANPMESMRTTDEMLQLIITWMLYEKGDEEIKLDKNE
ncbi:MAG: cytochrome c, partial [Chitinophagales bacterium]